MTNQDQLSYLKSVRNKLLTSQHRIEEYLDYLIEMKHFIEARENRYDEIRDIEILTDKLLKVLYNFDNPQEEEE